MVKENNMLIIMDMASGRREDPLTERYDNEVLHAGWAELPRLEPRLEVVTPQVQESRFDPAGYLAAFYAAQE
jgi:hypothetical protein